MSFGVVSSSAFACFSVVKLVAADSVVDVLASELATPVASELFSEDSEVENAFSGN